MHGTRAEDDCCGAYLLNTATDSAKTVRWSALYYPFGAVASENVSAQNNLRFPGQYHDRSTDLYYNMFRTYQPTLGRYLTPDPIGIAGGLDLYGYAGQNPTNYRDPMGSDNYRVSLQALLGVTVWWGADNGVNVFDAGIRLSWSFDFTAECVPGGKTPRYFRLDKEFDELSWIAEHVSSNRSSTCRTPLSSTTMMALASRRGDFSRPAE